MPFEVFSMKQATLELADSPETVPIGIDCLLEAFYAKHAPPRISADVLTGGVLTLDQEKIHISVADLGQEWPLVLHLLSSRV